MSARETQWYRSKIDWWMVPVLCVPAVAGIAVCVTAALSGSTTKLIVGVAASAFVASLYFGLVFPMRYGIDDTHMTVRNGLCCQRIPLASIAEVYPTRNPLSSPALSLDRLHVRFGQGHLNAVMISPENRDLFLDELGKQARLSRAGDRLSR